MFVCGGGGGWGGEVWHTRERERWEGTQSFVVCRYTCLLPTKLIRLGAKRKVYLAQ